jgi:LmbE family N-acetylglucosaminyl deacetylase
MEDWYIPYQTSKLPQAQRVLVLAPHPDDEIFGCGGALALYVQLGAQVDVVVVTDGTGFLLTMSGNKSA